MAYGRKRTSNYRKNRRNARTLSTRRIFNNKSAKAQAAQIHALRNSVRRIARANRPEIKNQYTTTGARTFDVRNGSLVPYLVDMPNISLGTSDTQRIGNCIKILPLKINTTMFYENVINSRLGYPPFSELREHGGQVRFVALQTKAAVDNPPDFVDVFRAVNFEGDINSSMMIRMPFKTGITSRYNILANKVFTLSSNKPNLSTTIKVIPKIRTITWEEGITYPRGHIWLIWLAGGLVMRTSEEGETTVYDYNSIVTAFRMELPFTDA